MSIYSNYHDLGKSNILCTKNGFIETVTEEGIKNIISNVLQGGNVRDVTEFITRNRLINSNAALLSLFSNCDLINTNDLSIFLDNVLNDLSKASNKTERTLSLWLLGLTNKGLDNIVRDISNLDDYKLKLQDTINDSINILQEEFGDISGSITLGGKTINVDWQFLSLFLSAIGSQTLTIRGSAKSMNGKLFEKLVLGTVISLLGFEYCSEPPKQIDKNKRLFWLSNMDESERETDATIVYNGKAISIDIGFIGKGNPEITLDKVSRFGAYKRIGDIQHDMSTIIIVDTVAEKSDLFNKATKVNGHVLQMIHNDWIIKFASLVCSILQFDHELKDIKIDELESYLDSKLKSIDITQFIK